MTALWITSMAMVLGYGLLYLSARLWASLSPLEPAEALRRASSHVALLTVSQALGMGGSVWVALRVGSDAGHRAARGALRLHGLPSLALALLFAAGLCLQVPLSELANLLYDHVFGPPALEEQRIMQQMLTPSGMWARLGVLVSLAFAIPLLEELLFRGVLLSGLVPTQGRGAAVLLTAALFGAAHVRPVPAVYAFVAGLLLAGVVLAFGSLWASVALHAGVNTLPVLVSSSTYPLPGFNVPTQQVQHVSASLCLGGLGAAAALVWAARWLHYRSSD